MERAAIGIWSCDIAAEHMIDGIYHRSVRFSRSLLRRETYRKLEAEKKVLNAERIYRILTAWELEEKELLKLEQEFIRMTTDTGRIKNRIRSQARR